ncbi:hypothetical protein DdX_13168 [Ditylenchus destructor]|uniref:G protein-coupled receptor n=1 Tax=Ditylenchus destructor TaxID=166010 RepID=A0AAD4MVQ4_9BILA|nr:hypothetical protein DdX_13168 [Ditylenchus destructor]
MLLTTSIPVFGYLLMLYCVGYPDPSRPIAAVTTQIYLDINETVEIDLLIYSAVLPCVGSLMSIMTVLTSALIAKESSTYIMAYFTMPVHWISVFNPVITIIVVGSYRREVFRRIFQTRVTKVRSVTNDLNGPV